MRSLRHWVLEWSNIFFLIPLVLAVHLGVYWYVVVLAAVFVVSFDFHFFHEAKEVYYLDVIFSSILMLLNVALLFMGHWALPFSATALILALIALLFYFRKSRSAYYMNHSLWHVFSAGVCYCCLLTFMSSL